VKGLTAEEVPMSEFVHAHGHLLARGDLYADPDAVFGVED
jgi:hypothetical protein